MARMGCTATWPASALPDIVKNSRIWRLLLSRLGRSAVIVAGILVVNFSLLHLAPGDAVSVLAGESGGADKEYVDRLRETYGLGRSLPEQLIAYAKGLLRFDLGWSFRNNTSVSELIWSRVPATLLLVGASVSVAVFIGVVLGVASSRRPNSATDNVISVVSLLAYATPAFWLGLMLIVLFSLKLGWLPTGGFRSADLDLRGFAAAVDIARHAVLPILTLSMFYSAIYARLTRASMLELAQFDYVRTAYAKGLSERAVRYRHVLRNALLPLATLLGIQFGSLLGGAIVIEMVFSWPGLGRLAFEAIMARDMNVLLGILFLSSLLVVFINIAVDMVYAILDPRIRAH